MPDEAVTVLAHAARARIERMVPYEYGVVQGE